MSERIIISMREGEIWLTDTQRGYSDVDVDYLRGRTVEYAEVCEDGDLMLVLEEKNGK